MSKGGKMFDAIMITIIIIALLNYADYIKVDTKLMMVLLAIALYVTAKQTQKSNQKNQKSQNVEPLDGSTVAFDKEAFVNLNAIVNELVKKDSVTIPGNLIVKGKTTFEDDMNVKGVTTMEKDLNVHTSVNVGTDDANAIRIRQNRIGTKGCCEMEFRSDGWVRHFTYGSNDYRANTGFAASTLYSRDHIHNQGTLRIDGGTVLHGTLTAHGQVTCNNTTLGGLTVNGTTTCNGEFRCEGRSSFKMRDNVYSHINEGGVCKIRSDLHLDGHAGSGRTVHCKTLYTHTADIDTLRGHAWANTYVNAVRVEPKFNMRNDQGATITFGGLLYEGGNHYSADISLVSGRYKSGNRGNIWLKNDWKPEDVSNKAHEDKPYVT